MAVGKWGTVNIEGTNDAEEQIKKYEKRMSEG
jgi:hypothetical protein